MRAPGRDIIGVILLFANEGFIDEREGRSGNGRSTKLGVKGQGSPWM